ncbi:MAG: YggS family pyridoxal phosphate-dependent enzyme [Bacteroidales bacterium]|nr:YggS family pyridoxal phosphate-dependent enzyme [Bacteroidales bacterium]MBO4566551.1 YggS family pyridoxal phosphate-dependent enzyme [Bacteroidales bacterium]
MSISDNIQQIRKELPSDVTLVAVSKFHPAEAIEEALAAGQTVFGENRPQELEKKAVALDGRGISWHFLGHLQTNKLKMVLPYASLVQSIDSEHLLAEVNAWGARNGKVIPVLLELHVAAEESKQGFFEDEALDILFRADSFRNIRFCGLMGMATNTDNQDDIRADFGRIKAFYDYVRDLFPEYTDFRELSIGMSGDWRIAIEYGATMVRIGTAIFGERV